MTSAPTNDEIERVVAARQERMGYEADASDETQPERKETSMVACTLTHSDYDADVCLLTENPFGAMDRTIELWIRKHGAEGVTAEDVHADIEAGSLTYAEIADVEVS